jgi:hypothetical protein
VSPTQIFGQLHNLGEALAVLTSMITPALLIAACGNFILSTSSRLGRCVDRMRQIADELERLCEDCPEAEANRERREMLMDQIQRRGGRVRLLQRSLTAFYTAAVVFTGTSVAIGFIALLGLPFAWIPVALGLLGACLLFYASGLMIVEARLSVAALDAETEFHLRLTRPAPRPATPR